MGQIFILPFAYYSSTAAENVVRIDILLLFSAVKVSLSESRLKEVPPVDEEANKKTGLSEGMAVEK